MHCCGADGPQDYMFSSWFNHTKDFDGLFVPVSCCVLSNSDLEEPVVKDESLCQVEAILVKQATKQPITHLNTQVRATL